MLMVIYNFQNQCNLNITILLLKNKSIRVHKIHCILAFSITR